ncbi:MAG: hypothetical protein RR101_10540 [Burkholderiaceae bacterium]
MAHPDTHTTAQVDAAIARVLASEQEAQTAIITAGERAAAQLEAARHQARAIAAGAEARVARCRLAIEREVATRSAEVDRQVARLRESPAQHPAQLARLQQAIDRLARELTGGRE